MVFHNNFETENHEGARMISIYDVAYEKCSMQSAKDKILSKMQPLKTNMKEIGNAPILTDNLCLRTAIRMILLQNKEIDSAYDNLELVNDNSGICTAISPSQKINTFDMLKLEYKYAHYGIGINTCDKRCKKPVDTLFQECSDYTAKLIKQLRIFQKCFGEIPTHECYFDGAYNDIVSKGYCGFPTYMLNDSIWIFNSMCLGDKWCLAVLLMAYVMGCHSRFPDYRKVTRLGIVNTSHGYIEILPVNQIPNLTFASVCTNYIGYNKTGNPSQWMNYCGTDNTRLESVLKHFKENLPEDIINKYTASKSNSYPINIDKNSINPLMNSVNLFPSSLQCTSDVKPAYLVNEKHDYFDSNLYIYYISDIHLEVKLSPKAFLDEHVLHNELCQKISSLFTKKFIQSISHRQKNYIVLFLGDIADTIHVSQLFYSMFIKKMKKYTSDTSLPIYAVLGNHEYSEFNTVEEGVAAYSNLFNELGINFANNDVFTADIGNFDKTKIEIVCGTGFAKYNDIHNADNLEGPHLLNHISEAAESDALYAAHNSAIAYPLTIEHPVIVVSHYPITDWIPQGRTSSRCVYFNGHTHHNTKKETQQLLIYADNQMMWVSKVSDDTIVGH